MSELAQAIRTELIRQMDEQGGYYADIPDVPGGSVDGLAIDGVVYYEEFIEALERYFKQDQRG